MKITSFADLASEAAKMTKKTVVAVVQAQDEHTLDAIVNAKREHIVDALLIGDEAKIRELLAHLGADAGDFEIVPAASQEEALKLAVENIHAGRASAIMKGKLESADFLRAVVTKENNLRGDGKLSLVGFYETKAYHKLFAVSDMGMNMTPDLDTKRAILENAVGLLRKLGVGTPKVAVLSESEKPNAKIPASVDAAELKKLYDAGEIAGCVVEGPISFDLATSAEAAKIKGYDSPVAGDADLLLVPDIVSGNILVKCLTGMAGATTAGTILGAKVPVIMMSRSAEAADKFYGIALAAVAAQ
ncbi:MAG: phosphate butyryltransferase Ptb [Oscillospiraceae bacterium]|jgi:phosphotransacetylase|nr:phosphate butyryltransferase Ptb [Oscillospiraceae bacterium]